MRHGSLFSGIGGFDLAAEWMGWENVFHCENNKFCQKILKHYWPDAKSYGDIKETDFTEWRGKIDIVSGGFPCQPYSNAGKRKGKADDRHLWPEMLRAIREIQPCWIVGENVPGLLNWKRGMVLDEIKADLETAGFEVIPPLVLPACGKNAPHRRDRLWIVAYADSFNTKKRYELKKGFERKTQTQFQRLDWVYDWYSISEESKIQCSVIRDNDGLPERLDKDTIQIESVTALGNSVVPQVVYEIFKAIEKL